MVEGVNLWEKQSSIEIYYYIQMCRKERAKSYLLYVEVVHAMRGRESIWQGFVSSISRKWNREHDNSYMTLEKEPDRQSRRRMSGVCR